MIMKYKFNDEYTDEITIFLNEYWVSITHTLNYLQVPSLVWPYVGGKKKLCFRL